MIVPNQILKVKWGSANKKHLESLGYTYTRLGDELEIKANELTDGSPQKVYFTCDYCNESFKSRFSSIRNKNQFCSRSCKCKWNTENPRTQFTTYCGVCNKEIKAVPSKLKHTKSGLLFCSNECVGHFNSQNHKENRIEKQCLICHSSYTVKPSESVNSVACSRECQNKWQSKYRIGENSPNYNSAYTLSDRTHNCDWCNKKYKLKNLDKISKKGNKDNPYFCSKACYREWYAKDWSQRTEWKEESKIRTVQMISDGKFPKLNNSVQKCMENILTDMDIKFISEFNCKYHAIDLYLPDYNIFIEMMGRFWHCDPRHYAKVQYKQQFTRIIQDKRKQSYIRNNYNSEILYIWEDEIKNEEALVKSIIHAAINSVLINYHSFNYSLVNNALKLNNDVIEPYFNYDIDTLDKLYIPKDRDQVIDRRHHEK